MITDLLGAMHMTPDASACPGLVRADTKTLAAKKRAGAPLEEIVALKRALHFGATYVYFRRFVERPAMPVAYLYDWTDKPSDRRRSGSASEQTLPKALSEELARLHSRVWSACEIPLVYVFLPTRVDVYHILQGPSASTSKHGINANPWKSIELAGELADALEQFSARRLDDGSFWEEHPDARALKFEGAAFMALSEEIARCRSKLVEKHGREKDWLIKRLLILFVMIKYLEERKDRDGGSVFPPGMFARFGAAKEGFVALLRAGGRAVLAFLDHLADKDRFNGDLFQLDPDERKALCETDLAPFADLLSADIEGEQRTFWRRYDFRELPVELISHIYEQFLPRQPGVVYTPPFLVSFILDQVLPLSESTPESFRLLDPACGSGVFLVGAFKRIVYRWWRDNSFRDPDVETLKRLLRTHIFGVDLEQDAIRLTMFSLSVTLCDFLEPRVIWDHLRFDRLKTKNLIKGDFFDQVRRERWDGADGFDVIVGNPPFVSRLTPAAADELASLKKADPGFELPDGQAALLFLQTATRITKPGAHIALIQPSGPLLYGENSSRFRAQFLSRVHVSQIIDFTHLSRVLFRRQRAQGTSGGGSRNPGDVAVAVVCAENRAVTDEPLLHVTVRRTVQAEQKLMFEIDHYDLHFVPRPEAVTNPGIWKANFIGGGRIPHLMRRLRRLPSLATFLEEAKKKRGWDAGEGFIAGRKEKIRRLEALLEKQRRGVLSDQESAELKRLRKRHREATWLTGHLALPTKALTSDGLDLSNLEPITERFFTEPRRASLFEGPLLLVKEVFETETETVPVALLQKGVRFKDRIYGIHAPREELGSLERIRDLLRDGRLVRFHVLSVSREYLINRSSAFTTADLLSLPFPESDEELELSPVEEALIDDALDHAADFKRKGDKAAASQPPSDAELRRYCDFFCRVLGSVYRSLRAAEPLRFSGGICCPFYFGEAPSERFQPGHAGALQLDRLLTTTVSPTLRCQRILRVFHGNMLLLVKPAQLRYWLRSIAIRDADEMFAELHQRGY